VRPVLLHLDLGGRAMADEAENLRAKPIERRSPDGTPR
jgi:hypothetical protein